MRDSESRRRPPYHAYGSPAGKKSRLCPKVGEDMDALRFIWPPLFGTAKIQKKLYAVV
jgi:hypothetical protein